MWNFKNCQPLLLKSLRYLLAFYACALLIAVILCFNFHLWLSFSVHSVSFLFIYLYVQSVFVNRVCTTIGTRQNIVVRKWFVFCLMTNLQALVVHFRIIHLLKSDSAWKMLTNHGWLLLISIIIFIGFAVFTMMNTASCTRC